MRLRILSFLLGFFLVLPTTSQAADVIVYPIKKIIGFNDSTIYKKAPAFGAWLEAITPPKLSAEFVATFKKEFAGIAVNDIDSRNKHRVIVASLHLIRASQYTVPKSGNVEYHLPITMSIVFTNPNTGEVIYSFTDTSYASVLMSASEQDTKKGMEQLINASAENYANLLAVILKKAKEGYNPVQVDATVVKIWNKLYILDKGSKLGIVRGDTLKDATGNGLKVLYETEDYAVAESLLVDAEKGQKFFKLANKSVTAQWKKPKVLTMHGGYKNEQLTTIAGLFDSELSKESAFTLLPVNENLKTLLATVGMETQAGQFEVTNQRVLPDYLIKFSAAPLRFYEVHQEGKFGFRIFEQYILGELLDQQGRIVYSAVGTNRIEDKVVGGMFFDESARREVVLKNSVVNLAEQFSSSIKFAHTVLPVTKVEDNAVFLEDTARLLRPNQTVKVYRLIGRFDGINGDVYVPIWDATVAETNNGKVKIDPLSPLSNDLKSVEIEGNDVVIVDAITAGKNEESKTSVTYCSTIPSKLGDVDINDFEVISRGFGYLLHYSLYDDDKRFREKIQLAVASGGFKESALKLGAVNTANRCLLPVHKTTVEKPQAGECNITLAVGFRLYEGQEKKGAAASQTKLTLSDVQETVLEQTIQCEISKNALGLLKDNIMKVQYQ